MIQRADQLVQAVYNLLLNREPDAAGLKHWSTALEGGLSQFDFVRAVLSSQEFKQSPAAVEDLTRYPDVDLIIPIGGQLFRVPAADAALAPCLLRHRCWEPHISRYLLKTLRADHVFVDVGAHIGYFTVLCAPLVQRVVAFEPTRRSQEYCRSNIALNSLGNVDLRPYGLWHEDTTLDVALDASGLMAAAVVSRPDGPSSESIRVVSLDGLIGDGRLEISRLDVLKMDVEGSELSALMGMRETLARFRPMVIMEVNRPMLAACGATIDGVWDALAALGYDIQTFESWKERDPDPVPGLDELKRRCPSDRLIDILAVPRANRSGKRRLA